MKKRRKYMVTGTMTISVHVDVEATSPAKAREIANEAAVMSLCHQCAHGYRDQWSTSGELDGEVEIIGVVLL